MKAIRIGNDINITWTILRNGSPENFTGKNLVVKLLDAMQSEPIIDYTISDNIIYISFFGKNQKQIGVYTLLLAENDGLEGMNTLDKIDAFQLVQHSCDATGQDECPNLSTSTIDLTSFIELGGINVVQTVGDSQTDVMSQRAVTNELNEIRGSLYDISVNEETETFNINNYE